MDRHVYSAPHRDLVAHFLAFANDREQHGKHARAAEARRCAATLERVNTVDFEGVTYEEGDLGHYSVIEGTKPQVLAEIDEYGIRCLHDGKTERAAAAARAYGEIERDACEAWAGHLLFRVVGNSE